MKVHYKHLLQKYSGKKDGLMYYYHPGKDCYIAREYVKPRETAHNRQSGQHRKASPFHLQKGRSLRWNDSPCGSSKD